MDNFDIEPGNGSPKKTRKGLNTVLWGVGSFALAVGVFFLIVTFFFPKAGTVNVTTPTETTPPVSEVIEKEPLPEITEDPNAAPPADNTAAKNVIAPDKRDKSCAVFLEALAETDIPKVKVLLEKSATESGNGTLTTAYKDILSALDTQADMSTSMQSVIDGCGYSDSELTAAGADPAK